MSEFKTKSWVAALSGVMLTTMATSALALGEVESNPSNTTNNPANIVSDAPTAVAGETSLTGTLYTYAPQGGDTASDEDAFSFYLDTNDTFTADLNYTSFFGQNPYVALFKDIGGNLTLAASGGAVSAIGGGVNQTSISFNPNDGGLPISGAGQYFLLVSNFGNRAKSGSATLDTLSARGLVWDNMSIASGDGEDAGSYEVIVAGIDAAPAIPVPAAVWLFGSGLMGLVGVARRRKV